jgi:hypothetical protein
MSDNQYDFNFAYWGPLLWNRMIEPVTIGGLLDRGLNLGKDRDHSRYLASNIDDVKSFTPDDCEWAMIHLEHHFQNYLQAEQEYLNNKNRTNRHVSGIAGMWINRQHQHETNPEHKHDGDLSFVIYLQVPEELRQENNSYHGQGPGPGTIQFRYGEYLDWVINVQTFFPQVGQMFIFPAELSHSVTPFRSNVERISISGNIYLR